MYICIYVYMYICTYVHMYICTYVHMYICTYVHMCICIGVQMYISIMYKCVNVSMYYMWRGFKTKLGSNRKALGSEAAE